MLPLLAIAPMKQQIPNVELVSSPVWQYQTDLTAQIMKTVICNRKWPVWIRVLGNSMCVFTPFLIFFIITHIRQKCNSFFKKQPTLQKQGI